jgi:hypothetical protein
VVDDPERIELGRQYYRNALATFDAYDAQAMVHSQWSQQRGQKPVYVDFDYDTHVKDFEPETQYPLQVGIDYGLSCAAVIGQKTPKGFRIVDEVTMFETGIDSFAAELKRRLATWISKGYRIGSPTGWGDPAGDQRSAQAGATSSRAIMAKLSLNVQSALFGNNAIGIRVDAVNYTFRNRPDAREGILIHPRCKDLIRAALREYVYRQLASHGDRFMDTPDKQNPFCHIADALQYFLLGHGVGRALLHGTNARQWPTDEEGNVLAFRQGQTVKRGQAANWSPFRC